MMIERYASLVGSITGADPNSQAFQNPEWHRRRRRKSAQDDQPVEEDVSQIASPTGDRSLSEAKQSRLGSAISFNQTQEAFLVKVEESLRRMEELSVLARTDSLSDQERQAQGTEFDRLRDEIQEIGARLVHAADLFHSTAREWDPDEQLELAFEFTDHGALSESLETTCEQVRAGIGDVAAAAAAEDSIRNVLAAVSSVRTKVELDLQQLSLTILELPPQSDPEQGLQIQNVNVAEESTQTLRNNILIESGTAMLAQANALPQSALRLLG